MPALDAIDLARAQFALNISFHILFPAITIGLAWLLLYFRARFTLSSNEAWEYAYYFWVKIFALTFALGVVSGLGFPLLTSAVASVMVLALVEKTRIHAAIKRVGERELAAALQFALPEPGHVRSAMFFGSAGEVGASGVRGTACPNE